MKRLAVLGSTGSVGVSTLEVVAAHRERFQVVALAAGRNVTLLKEQIERFNPALVAVRDNNAREELHAQLGFRSRLDILSGDEGYFIVASATGTDMVVSALVGAAGLLPTLAAVEAGKDLALANKETLVIAGAQIMEAARRKGVRILPVDSEHSAVFQCLEGQRRDRVRRIILTGSGGPFRRKNTTDLASVTPEDALKHPNWRMGRKITIDSATLMNKGLEVIEAHWLFGIHFDSIEVVIHPQSIIHSMVEFTDGSIMAQLGVPDMRIPISYALSYPDRISSGVSPVDFASLTGLTFERPDETTFPCLGIAFEAGRMGGDRPAVMNAANEVAVEAFLAGRISFPSIAAVIKGVLNAIGPLKSPDIKDLMDADRRSRDMAKNLIEEFVPPCLA